jgi:hypothetical protein
VSTLPTGTAGQAVIDAARNFALTGEGFDAMCRAIEAYETQPAAAPQEGLTVRQIKEVWHRANGEELENTEFGEMVIEFAGALLAEQSAAPVEQPAAAPIEEMIRFCPECGHLGDITAGYEACCPDWSQARVVPKRFAELCAETFRLCVSQPFPKSSAAQSDERTALPQIPDLVKAMAWLTVSLRTELSRLDDNTHKALDEVEAQLSCVRALTNGAIDYEAMVAARASSANETGAEGAAVAWMSTDDPRDCISDAKKRDMIEHAGAPGARLAEKYSIALGVITPAQAAEPVALSGTMMIEAAARSGLRATMGRLNATDILDPLEAYTLDVLRQIGAAPQLPAQADAREGLTDEQIEEAIYQHIPPKVALMNAKALHAMARALYPGQPEPRAEVTAAARDVLAERRRQVEQEGWTPAHDDAHSTGDMALAAACYAAADNENYPPAEPPDLWPWDANWWKPTDERRNLVKAGALILAEIERLDRAAARAGDAQGR